MAPLIPGVSRLDATRAIDAIAREQITEIEARVPMFVKGEAALASGQEAVLEELVNHAVALGAAAAVAGRRFRIEVTGHADADGPDEANLPLSHARADVVGRALATAVGERLEVIGTGAGSDNPFGSSPDESVKQKNRSVTVRVTPVDRTSPPDRRP
jgi:outer membrane protein OmpA-like peptidoglycan-associated protein